MHTIVETTQICIGLCGRELLVNAENFYRAHSCRSGFSHKCKRCARAADKIKFQKAQINLFDEAAWDDKQRRSKQSIFISVHKACS